MNIAQYGAIFDLDGTLTQSEVLYQRATAAIVEKAGRSLSELTAMEKAAIPGRSALENMTFYHDKFELPWRPEFLVAKRIEMVLQMVRDEGVMLIPGAYEFCRTLKSEPFAMAVASSSPEKYVNLVLKVTGLDEFFPVVLSGDDVSSHKPHPEIFDLAREKIGMPSHRCVVFEDADAGLRAAGAAGMKSILIDNETILPEQKVNATRVIPHYCGLRVTDVKTVINGLILMN